MKKQVIYAVLALLGAGLTWYNNICFSLQHDGFVLGTFISQAFANHAAASLGWDVTIAAVTFLTWSNIECKRLQMKNWWVIAALTMGVALAFAFPFFLLLRERHLARIKALPGRNPGKITGIDTF